MTSGAQAHAYADNFIAYHLTMVAGGKTYSQVRAESLAQPGNAKLAGEVETLFRGTTLRGLPLNAYAYWQIGQIALIALIAGIVALCAAFVMLIMSVLGFRHVRRASPDTGLLGREQW